MGGPRPHSNPDAEIVLAWITRDSHKGGHHPRCATGHDNGCDCYARATEPARAALGRLIEQLESARQALTEIAYDGPNPGLRRSEEFEWASDIARRALASNPASRPDVSEGEPQDRLAPEVAGGLGVAHPPSETSDPAKRPSDED